MLVWKKRQVIHAAEVRAIAQSALGGDQAEKAYTDFLNHLTQQKDEEVSRKDMLREKLEDMKKIQAIKVTPLDPGSLSKRQPLKRVKR